MLPILTEAGTGTTLSHVEYDTIPGRRSRRISATPRQELHDDPLRDRPPPPPAAPLAASPPARRPGPGGGAHPHRRAVRHRLPAAPGDPAAAPDRKAGQDAGPRHHRGLGA